MSQEKFKRAVDDTLLEIHKVMYETMEERYTKDPPLESPIPMVKPHVFDTTNGSAVFTRNLTAPILNCMVTGNIEMDSASRDEYFYALGLFYAQIITDKKEMLGVSVTTEAQLSIATLEKRKEMAEELKGVPASLTVMTTTASHQLYINSRTYLRSHKFMWLGDVEKLSLDVSKGTFRGQPSNAFMAGYANGRCAIENGK